MSKITKTIVLKVSGKEAENTFSGLGKVVRDLEKELKKLSPGTEEFKLSEASRKSKRILKHSLQQKRP